MIIQPSLTNKMECSLSKINGFKKGIVELKEILMVANKEGK